MNPLENRNRLTAHGLKVTPQRLAILEAVHQLHNHPTADQIIDYIRNNHPNIATGTVYKVLDALVDHHLMIRVKTDKDIMRYDADLNVHHHLYCSDSDSIEDYFDDELNRLLDSYFRKKKIPGFHIEDIKLQIIGTFSSREA
jgi:Fur family transcriptional regulator, peroxide stress response regulator